MFKNRVVKKALDELSNRTVNMPETVRSVICLIDLSILNEANLNSYIQEIFGIKKNKIMTVYYAPKHSKEFVSYIPLFCNRHLHWDGTLVHPMKKKIFSKKYDLLTSVWAPNMKMTSPFLETAGLALRKSTQWELPRSPTDVWDPFFERVA